MIKKLFNGEIEILTVGDMAKTLGVNIHTIRRYVRTGKLKAQKIGRNYYVSKENFREFVSGGRTAEATG